jgi:hypothetical protein
MRISCNWIQIKRVVTMQNRRDSVFDSSQIPPEATNNKTTCMSETQGTKLCEKMRYSKTFLQTLNTGIGTFSKPKTKNEVSIKPITRRFLQRKKQKMQQNADSIFTWSSGSCLQKCGANCADPKHTNWLQGSRNAWLITGGAKKNELPNR